MGELGGDQGADLVAGVPGVEVDPVLLESPECGGGVVGDAGGVDAAACP